MLDSYPGILSNLPVNAVQLLNQTMIETELSEGSILFKQRDEAQREFSFIPSFLRKK